MGSPDVPLRAILDPTYSLGGTGNVSLPIAYLIAISQELAAESNNSFAGSASSRKVSPRIRSGDT